MPFQSMIGKFLTISAILILIEESEEILRFTIIMDNLHLELSQKEVS